MDDRGDPRSQFKIQVGILIYWNAPIPYLDPFSRWENIQPTLAFLFQQTFS